MRILMRGLREAAGC